MSTSSSVTTSIITNPTSSSIYPREHSNDNHPTTTTIKCCSTIPFLSKEIILFFLVGIGSTVAWTAVLSNLVFYTAKLGTMSFPVLNLAVYFPLLPISVAQAVWDEKYDLAFSSLTTFSFRGNVAFLFMLIMTLLLPLASNSLALLTTMTFILGTASAILYGTLNQLASLVYHDSGTLPAAYTSGLQASAALVLATSIATKFGGAEHDDNAQWAFYGTIGALVAISWLAYFVLISKSHSVRQSMVRRDSSMRSSLSEVDLTLLSGRGRVTPLSEDNQLAEEKETEHLQQPLLSPTSQTDTVQRSPSQAINDEEVTFSFLWKRTWPHCLSLIITVASSMAVASSFNQAKSTNPNNDSLPRILFYVRLFSDLLGRPATLLIQPGSVVCLGIVSALRLAFVPLFFLDIDGVLKLDDWIMILGVALFAFTSGYIATGCRQLAPNALSDTRVEVTVPKQSSLINVSFSLAILLGLMVTFILLLT